MRTAKTIVHINQHVIKRNRTQGTNDPPITVKRGETNTYAHAVDILDAQGAVVARVVHQPHKPLSCGARVWIESYAELRFDPCDVEEEHDD